MIPIEFQKNNESRKLWNDVTQALKKGDLNSASLYNSQIEKQQRTNEKLRREQNIDFLPVYFNKAKLDINAYLNKINSYKINHPITPILNENNSILQNFWWLHKKF